MCTVPEYIAIYNYKIANGQRQISAWIAPLNGSLTAWTIKNTFN